MNPKDFNLPNLATSVNETFSEITILNEQAV